MNRFYISYVFILPNNYYGFGSITHDFEHENPTIEELQAVVDETIEANELKNMTILSCFKLHVEEDARGEKEETKE